MEEQDRSDSLELEETSERTHTSFFLMVLVSLQVKSKKRYNTNEKKSTVHPHRDL